jgi:hypothetical protein
MALHGDGATALQHGAGVEAAQHADEYAPPLDDDAPHVDVGALLSAGAGVHGVDERLYHVTALNENNLRSTVLLAAR